MDCKQSMKTTKTLMVGVDLGRSNIFIVRESAGGFVLPRFNAVEIKFNRLFEKCYLKSLIL